MSRVTRARLVEAMDALESRGHPVRGLKIDPDGSYTLLTDAQEPTLAFANDGDLVDLAGSTEISRAQGA